MPEKRSFGQMTKLPSGRIRARYLGPDGKRHSAPYTFETKQDAEAWLVDERRLLATETWAPPKDRVKAAQTQLTFAVYADSWLRERTLKPRTRAHYRRVLDRHILPTFGHAGLKQITAEGIRTWHALIGPEKPTQRAHAYSLLRTILGTAVQDGLVASNPAYIRGAGNSVRVHKIKPASLDELEVIVTNMPERYRVMALRAC